MQYCDAMPRWKNDDGGREAAGFRGIANDCVVRSIAIVTEQPYREVYDALTALAKTEKRTKRQPKPSSARMGVYKTTYMPYLRDLGFIWVPTMGIGQGCTVHLRAEELPPGRLLVQVTKHLTAVIDGVIHGTHDPSREGTRCVYGYHYSCEEWGGGHDATLSDITLP